MNKKDIYEIFNIDKFGYASTPERFKIFKNKKLYKFKKLNLCSLNSVSKVLEKFKPEFIVHLAAESHVDRSIDDPYHFIIENITATLSLYKAILNINKKFKPKIIHVSTDEVFGSIINGSADENSKLKPNNPYSASKASCDHIARSFLKTYNLDISIIRFCNNYGPYQFPEKFIPTIISKIFNKKKIPIYGDGKNKREWIFVEDTCIAIEKLIRNFRKNINYNIGSGKLLSNIQVVKKILNLLKEKSIINNIEFVTDRPGHDLRYSINSKKFNKKFKMNYRSFDKGIESTLKWYSKNQEWHKNTKTRYKGKRIGKI